MYRILFAKSADKALRGMPRELAQRIREQLDLIAQDPYAQHNNVTKLQNRPGYRLRVGDWRVIYEVGNNRLIIFGAEDRVTRRSVSMNVQVIEKGGKPGGP
jgi:mRNA interferase RelE/StbE